MLWESNREEMISLNGKKEAQKGFTLVELMVVIAIIGILSAVIIPKFSQAVNAAKDVRLKADLRSVDSSAMQYYAAKGSYPENAAAFSAYLTPWPNDATGTALVYETAENGYIVKGTSIDNTGGTTSRRSPGSVGYAAW